MSRRGVKAVGNVPVVVLGGGFNGLGVVRSLGAAGVRRVYLADTDLRRAETHSRYAQPLLMADLCGVLLIEELLRLGKTRFAGQQPVLILTQEQTVRTVAMAQEALRPLFRFLLPPGEVLETLMHKEGFDRVAAQTGLRVPRTVHVRDAAGIDAALALTYPLIVKPAVHDPAYQSRFRKAYRVGEEGEARDLLDRILEMLPDVVVQEWIPGEDSAIYFCLQQLSPTGKAEASFVGRKIRSWPPNVGGTASCTSASEAAELIETTARFFAQAGMRGLASMEYKRHAVTGEYVAIEPTVGRTDYQEEVATLNGVNLPFAYYRSVLGMDGDVHEAIGPDHRLIWRDRQADEQSLAHPDQLVHGWPAEHGEICDALWRRTDPGPWLAAQWQRVARKSEKLLNRFKSERTTT